MDSTPRKLANQKHGSPAETKPDSTIFAQGAKMDCILLDPKLYSKVLTTTPTVV